MKWIFVGKTEISKEIWRGISNGEGINNKPKGGLWSCPYNNDYPHSAWIEFSKENGWYTNDLKCQIFTLKKDAKVYTIDSYKDLVELTNRYELGSPFGMMMFMLSRQIDFEKVAKDYDVIYLTNRGQCATRFGKECSLYGWDFETGLVLNYNAIDTKSIESIKVE